MYVEMVASVDIPDLYFAPSTIVWCSFVLLGTVLNAALLTHSCLVVRRVRAEGHAPSLVEAAKAKRFVDTAALFCQLCFWFPGYLALTMPAPDHLSWKGWAFTASFIAVEVALVVMAAVTAAWARRIGRYRLNEGSARGHSFMG